MNADDAARRAQLLGAIECDLTQEQAAMNLGIAPSSVGYACKRLGIVWPWQFGRKPGGPMSDEGLEAASRKSRASTRQWWDAREAPIAAYFDAVEV